MIEEGVPAGRIVVISNGGDLYQYRRTDEASRIALGAREYVAAHYSCDQLGGAYFVVL